MDTESTPKAQQEAISFHATQDPISGGGHDPTPTLGTTAGSLGVCVSEEDSRAVAFQSTESHSSGVNDDLSPTLRVGSGRGELRESDTALRLSAGGGKPGQGYPAARQGHTVRRLTPTECERLMGWPDGWTVLHTLEHIEPLGECSTYDPAPDARRYAACGDGVVAPVAQWIGQRLFPFALDSARKRG